MSSGKGQTLPQLRATPNPVLPPALRAQERWGASPCTPPCGRICERRRGPGSRCDATELKEEKRGVRAPPAHPAFPRGGHSPASSPPAPGPQPHPRLPSLPGRSPPSPATGTGLDLPPRSPDTAGLHGLRRLTLPHSAPQLPSGSGRRPARRWRPRPQLPVPPLTLGSLGDVDEQVAAAGRGLGGGALQALVLRLEVGHGGAPRRRRRRHRPRPGPARPARPPPRPPQRLAAATPNGSGGAGQGTANGKVGRRKAGLSLAAARRQEGCDVPQLRGASGQGRPWPHVSGRARAPVTGVGVGSWGWQLRGGGGGVSPGVTPGREGSRQ